MNRLIVIGAGNVGGTLIRKLVNKSFPAEIIAVEKDRYKRDRLPITALSKVADINFSKSHTLLCVHSHELKDLKHNLLNSNQPEKIISTLAGVSVLTLQKLFPSAVISRVMPNISMKHETSNSVIYSECNELAKYTEEIFKKTGNPIRVKDENFMDIATSLVGTSPAIFLKMAEVMSKEAVDLGLPKDLALEFAKAGLLAANSIKNDHEDLSQTIEKITSPGGTTQVALKVLERYDFEEAIISAIRKATSRGIEIDIAVERQIKDN